MLWRKVRCRRERIVAERRRRPRRGYLAEVMNWGGVGEVKDLGFDLLEWLGPRQE